MVTKKLTPVKPEATESDSVQAAMLLELQKQTEYMHRIDWKLWMIMNMFKTISEENGYKFSMGNRPDDDTDQEA
jgi:hypothetical protein